MEGASPTSVVDRRNARINFVDKASGISIPLFRSLSWQFTTDFKVLDKAKLPGAKQEELILLACQGTADSNAGQRLCRCFRLSIGSYPFLYVSLVGLNSSRARPRAGINTVALAIQDIPWSFHGEEWPVHWLVRTSTGTYPPCRQQLPTRWQSRMVSKVRVINLPDDSADATVFCALVNPIMLQEWKPVLTSLDKDCACLYHSVRQLPRRRQVRQGISTSSGFANHATLIV